MLWIDAVLPLTMMPSEEEKKSDTGHTDNAADDKNHAAPAGRQPASNDDIVTRYDKANKAHLIQRLLVKKWSILNEIEQFLIDVDDNDFDEEDETARHGNEVNADPPQSQAEASGRNRLDTMVLNLIKHQHYLRTHALIRHPHDFNIMQTSNHINALQSLSINELNAILHDFDTISRDIRELIISQHGTLLFTAMPIEETIDLLLSGYRTISQY